MKSMVERFRFRRPPSAHEEELRELTDQFYVTLSASFSRVNATIEQPAAKRIRELLDREDRSWTDAYEIEQLLISLLDEATVATELDLRTLETRGVLRPEQADHYARETESLRKATDAGAPERRRILLARLVNDLQWRYTVNEARRRYAKGITSRAGTLFVVALLLFAAGIAAKVLFPVTFKYDDLRLFLFTGIAGAWGATFSMLSTLRSRLEGGTLDDLKLMRPWVMLTSRMLIGAGAACILYFFILSGLLGGAAFPRLTAASGPEAVAASAQTPAGGGVARLAPDAEGPATSGPALPDTQLALLVVWAFIAGFSEQLVPGLLARTESRAGGRAPTGDRFRPTSNGGGRPPAPEGPGTPPARPATPEAGRRPGEGDGEPASGRTPE